MLEEVEGVALLHIDEDLLWTFGGLLELYLYVKPERGEEVHIGTIGMSPRHYPLGRWLASEGESEQATVAAYDILLDNCTKLVALSEQSYTAATPLGCIQFYVWAVILP